MWWLGALEEA
jgi:hypothetical protein